MLTDSGGFQVFSLADRRRLTEDGAEFRSHLDGSLHMFTPERAVDIQARLGSDIAMVLDECLAYPATREARRRPRWRARRAGRDAAGSGSGRRARGRRAGAPIRARRSSASCRAGCFPDLRKESVDLTREIGFEGYAIGGLSVGEPIDEMYATVELTARPLPPEQPRYLMGAGTPEDLVECVARGIDMFDCVMPTRNARNGQLFTSEGRINIRNARYADDPRAARSAAVRLLYLHHHSRAYLRHVYMAGEAVARTLNTLHNLTFYLDTMQRIRDAIALRTFDTFRQEFLRLRSS